MVYSFGGAPAGMRLRPSSLHPVALLRILWMLCLVPCERIVSAQALRAESAVVIRAQARRSLLPMAHVRNQKISLDLITLRKCNPSTQDSIQDQH
jgi:hypothetical protein